MLGKEVVVCHKCGFKAKKGGEDGRKEEVASKNVGSEASLKVMDSESSVDALPTTSIECPECKNDTAFWWTAGIFAGDASSPAWRQIW